MGLMSFIRSELIEIIEWLDESNQTLVWRFPDEDHAIKIGARLVCRPGQVAIFVNEGKVADIFGPGTYALTTANLPIMTRIANWKHGFNSPFKAEVYFVNLKQCIAQRWGTSTPVLIRDPHFARGGRPGAVRFRAYGTYNCRVVDPAKFFYEVVGSKGLTLMADIETFLRSRLMSTFANAAAKAELSVMEMAAHYDVLAHAVASSLADSFAALGLQLTSFVIESISLPPEVEKAIDAGAALSAQGVDSALAWESAQAMREAARNPSSGAAGLMNAGMGLGAGLGMGQAMGHAFGLVAPAPASSASRSQWTPAPDYVSPVVAPPAAPKATAPSPSPAVGLSPQALTDKLTALKAAFEAELLTPDEYNSKKRELLAAF